MDEVSQARFDKLVKLNPRDLTLEETQFLNARIGYMNDLQKETFKSIFPVEVKKVEKK